MGKITLGVLVAAIALGAYWFWWSDQGANAPITVEGTVSLSGMTGATGGAQKADFTLHAVPNKIRIAAEWQKQKVSAMFDLSKKQVYVLNESKKKYGQEEFNYVEMSKTELYEDTEETWPKELTRTAEWDYVGSGDSRRFCNKQTVKELPKEVLEMSGASGGGAEAAMMQAMLKNLNAEFWFTPETRLGRRYFSTLNKFARIKPVGSKGTIPTFGVGTGKEKRPQFKYVNLDFFPVPMKGTLSMGTMRVELNVRSLSRKKIPKDAFEVPSGYTKVDMKEVMQ